jgi:hypothetical protein
MRPQEYPPRIIEAVVLRELPPHDELFDESVDSSTDASGHSAAAGAGLAHAVRFQGCSCRRDVTEVQPRAQTRRLL